MMATLSRMFHWRHALVNVKPDTLIRWHRKGFRLFWRWKSKPTGRPPTSESRYGVPAGYVIQSTAVLGGLHHEHALENVAA